MKRPAIVVVWEGFMEDRGALVSSSCGEARKPGHALSLLPEIRIGILEDKEGLRRTLVEIRGVSIRASLCHGVP